MCKFRIHFSFGGVSGIAVIMRGLLGGSASTYTFVIDMLLLVVAFILLGKEVAMQSAHVSVLYSVTLEAIQYCLADVKATYKSAGVGTCISLYDPCSMFRNFLRHECIQRGIAYIALILKKYTNVSIETALLVVDFIVVIVAFFVYGVTAGLYLTGRIPCEVIFY